MGNPCSTETRVAPTSPPRRYGPRMKRFACTVLFVVLSVSACTSEDDTAASASESGTPEAYCPVLVDLAVESALAGAAVDDSAGPGVINGPEFAGTRELFGELIQVVPPRVRELFDAAGFEPEKGEVADPDAARAMYEAIADLPASCTGEQPAECTDRITALRQETNPAAFTDAKGRSLTEVCSAPSYLAGSDECDALALAILREGDGELPILEHFAERCD